MSASEQLLVRTHKNAEMGKNTLDKLIPIIKDRDLKALLQIQHDEYNRIFMSAEILLRSDGIEADGVSGQPEMAVRVHQPRVDMQAGGLHGLGRLSRQIAANLDDLAVLDEDVPGERHGVGDGVQGSVFDT